MPVKPLSAIERILPVAARLRTWWYRNGRPERFNVTPPRETRPAVPSAYMPLYTYLNRRYAETVVLTFEQIEALLGFAPPAPAFADPLWWTTAPGEMNDRHSVAWDAAGRRAAPHMSSRTVTFERFA